MAADDSSDRTPPQGSVDDGPTLPSDPTDQVRRAFPIERDLDRLLRAEALRSHGTESAIVRRVLRRHFGSD